MNKLAIFNDNQPENFLNKHGLGPNLKGHGSTSNRTGVIKKPGISPIMSSLATKNLNLTQILRLLQQKINLRPSSFIIHSRIFLLIDP
ncbi:MAG: hypothetical protein CMM83_06715 [Rhodospirillales bacterium]|nr:hypothetical protein [Rhodospirillales bacterium]